jgi:hypothetical protein
MGQDRGRPDSLAHCDSPWLTTDVTDDEDPTAFVERDASQKATNTQELMPWCSKFNLEHTMTGGTERIHL